MPTRCLNFSGKKVFLLISFIVLFFASVLAQCISSFPHTQDFEGGAAGWTSGTYSGSSNTWALGTPNKSIINSACGGSNAWIIGGLTGLYDAGEHSYVQSPCYDFSGITNPMLSVCIWIETEGGYDGTVLQASVGGGAWEDVGGTGSTSSCEGATNWYNDASVNYLDGYGGTTGNGWNGNDGTLTGSGCTSPGGGSGGWITATHCLPGAGSSNVQFRFLFGAGTTCQAEGFAFDNFTVSSGTGVGDVTPAFTITGCSKSGSRRELQFDDTSTGDACFTDYEWEFGDGNTELGSASPGSANTDNGYMATGTYTACLSYSNGTCNEKTYCCDVTISDSGPGACTFTTSGCGILLSSQHIYMFGKTNEKTNELIINISEPNTFKKITLEKSSDGKIFEYFSEISFPEKNTYSFEDFNPKRKTYYRAKLLMKNNFEELSSTLILTNNNYTKSFYVENLAPNPSDKSFSFDITVLERNQHIELKIINVLGQVVHKQFLHNSQGVTIDSENFQSGLYTIVLESENDIFTEKILIQH